MKVDLSEIRELLMSEASKEEPRDYRASNRSEQKEYARGIRDAYYLIEDYFENNEANKKGDT